MFTIASGRPTNNPKKVKDKNDSDFKQIIRMIKILLTNNNYSVDDRAMMAEKIMDTIEEWVDSVNQDG